MIKINWGVRIILVYVAFVVFMLSLVYLCTQQHFELVSKDYYAQELAYQGTIDGGNNARKLSGKVSIQQTDELVNINLPVAEDQASTVFFYRPSNAAQDFSITANGANVQVQKNKLYSGLYKVKISWSQQGKPFYDEQSLFVTK
ncbi:MAG: hypothetical protein EAY75_11840 [Bacteroidetes bacterium]|nr:MAG: hypothetical protein EAY75_11840 [Bacteroidota bacterium]